MFNNISDMDIINFLSGFAKRPTPIKVGDQCRNKITGKYSVCLQVHGGMYYGRDINKQLEMGIIENFEKA